MQITNASQLTGVFPALFTPLKNDDPKNLRNSIDYKKMGQMIDDVIAAGASGVLPAVTTGQSATVSPQQHLDIIKFTLDYVDGRVPVIAGAGSNCTRESIEMIENVLKIKETLELTTFFLASEISNYLLLDKLKVLSTIDTLTSVRNRNEMNNRVDRIVAGNEPVPQGVLFADLNGLKRVNDEQGHAAGDKMLCAAASILQSVFQDGVVYRAGGDEFMILVNEISEDEVQDRVARVHFLSGKTENVRFSIGVCYGKKDIRKAMRLADERMYAFKNGYYEAHPELKYR